MATKMVLRKQTGHICVDCKASFKAKELLIEHSETCSVSRGIVKQTETKVKVTGSISHLNVSRGSTDHTTFSELGVMLTKDLFNLPAPRVVEVVTSPSTTESNDRSVATSTVPSLNIENNSVFQNVDSDNTLTVASVNSDGGLVVEHTASATNVETIEILNNCILLPAGLVTQDQNGEQVMASLVDVTNVEGFFDDDVCAFEVIEEIVGATNNGVDKISEMLPLQQNKPEKSVSNSISAESIKKINKKRRINSGSNSSSEVINSSSNSNTSSNCNNNTSVYSLCLAAEIASSMETVQAAKSLLGMSLQQGEVETEDGGNVKMVSILRKKPEMINQSSVNKDPTIGTENQLASGIKKELEEQLSLHSPAPSLNVISKISFLQSLNNRIIGKESSGADLSALITTPVVCDAKVKVEVEGDDGFTQTPSERKIAKLNFNVLRSSNSNITRIVGERPRSTLVQQNISRQVYTSPISSPNNIFRGRQASLSSIHFPSQDASLIPVTNEVEVMTEVVKMEDKMSVNLVTNRQYILQVPGDPAATVPAIAFPLPKTHSLEVKDTKLYVCGLCNKAFDDCETLKLHVEKHIGMERQNSNKVKNCEEKISDEESTGEDESDDTKKQGSGGSRHECRECGAKFPRLSLLKKHAKAEHGGLKAYVCGACNKTFAFACGLKLHALTHGAERRYSCQFCGRRFKHASNLQKHVKVVHVNACKCRTVECMCGKRDPTSFKIDHACRICGRVCESSKHLEIHHRSHTGEKPEVCLTCGKSFQHKSNLQKHQLKHTGIRPYKCPHCERSFFVKHSYLGHMRLHTRDSPYTCETCGKSFISKNGLQVHSILHQDRLPFCCGQCGREFAQLGNLNKHLSLHTGDKPFPCNFCEKKFVDTSALKRHMVIHTRERNYSCPECGKTFLHFSSLRSHMTTHKFDEQERHQCNICNKVFTVKSNYLRHMKQHEETPETEQIEYLVYMQ